MDRPRRTTRQPAKTAKVLVAPDPAPRVARRKVDPEQRLNTLLENSKSELTTMELSVRINQLAFERYRHFEKKNVFILHAVNYCQATGAQWASSSGYNQRANVANAFRRLSNSS